MISFASVSKTFGKNQVLTRLNFTAESGEIIGFLGPNGAGKTTTMRLLLGYLIPTSGRISVNKLNPAKSRVEALNLIGYLPENNPLYGEMKAGEYLHFISRVKQADPDRIALLTERVGIADQLLSKIETLSRGYKQRVGLAAALIGDPEILILDEPTSGLDPIEQEKIRALIKEIAPKKTILFSTHILSEAEDVATRLIIIDRGEIVYDGDKPKRKGAVEKLFKKLVIHHSSIES